MLERPEGLQVVKINIEFNFHKFNILEIDLPHVNKNSRSNYSAKQVSAIANRLIDGQLLAPAGEKQFGKDFCTYYVKTDYFGKYQYKIVFCICSDRPNSLGIITMHRK